MENHYRRWDDPDVVRRFAEKGVGDFFETETHFLDRIGAKAPSVLDIGCSSGRFIELLCTYCADFAYTGIDIGPANIERARRLYPQARFFQANALELELTESFDLVNATGVMQHEPRFEDLIGRMIVWSARYVLFDVKLARLNEHLVDRDCSFTGSAENRLYFNVLSLPLLRTFLEKRTDVQTVSIYGYETPLNTKTVVPAWLRPVISAGVLLEKRGAGDGGIPAFDIDQPKLL